MKTLDSGSPQGPVGTNPVSLPLGGSASFQVLIWLKQFQLWFRNNVIPRLSAGSVCKRPTSSLLWKTLERALPPMLCSSVTQRASEMREGPPFLVDLGQTHGRCVRQRSSCRGQREGRMFPTDFSSPLVGGFLPWKARQQLIPRGHNPVCLSVDSSSTPFVSLILRQRFLARVL